MIVIKVVIVFIVAHCITCFIYDYCTDIRFFFLRKCRILWFYLRYTKKIPYYDCIEIYLNNVNENNELIEEAEEDAMYIDKDGWIYFNINKYEVSEQLNKVNDKYKNTDLYNQWELSRVDNQRRCWFKLKKEYLDKPFKMKPIKPFEIK